MELKRDFAANDRRCHQVLRVLTIVECMRRLSYASMDEIQWNLRRSKIHVHDRTVRRDLAVLVKLNWCIPDERDNKTIWRWVKR